MSGGAGAHTPEPWVFEMEGDWPMIRSAALDDEGNTLPVVDLYHGGYVLAEQGYTPEAVGERIVACVNALAGIPTDQLDGLMGEVRDILEMALPLVTDPEQGGFIEREVVASGIATLLAKLPVQS